MSIENPSYVASGAIAPSRFVKQVQGAQFRVSEAQYGGTFTPKSGDVYAGVSQEGSSGAPNLTGVTSFPAANDGERLKVYGPGEQAILVIGATVSAGNYLKADANSLGIPVTLTATADPEEYGAIAYESGVSGGVIRVKVVQPGFYIDN